MSLVMEYLPYGSLIGYLENNRQKVNTSRMLLFASQICKVSLQLDGDNLSSVHSWFLSGEVREHG